MARPRHVLSVLVAAGAFMAANASGAGEGGTILAHGTVTRPGGIPVPGAKVYIRNGVDPFESGPGCPSARCSTYVAGRDGTFSIPRSEELLHRLGGSVAQVWAEDGTLVSRAHRVRLELDADLQVDCVLLRRLRLAVAAHQQRNASVRGAEVRVELTDADRPRDDSSVEIYTVSGVTDAEGRFVTFALPSSTHTVEMAYLMCRGSKHSFFGGTVRQVHTAGEVNLWLDLPPTSTIRGRVLEADGTPARRLEVAVLRRDQPTPMPDEYVKVDPEGGFEVDSALVDGSKLVFVATELRPNGVDLRVVHGVALPAPVEDLLEVGEVRLPSRRRVVVSVVDEVGSPLTGAVGMERSDFDLGVVVPWELDAEGRVAFDRVPTGVRHNLVILVVHPKYGDLEMRDELGATDREKRVTVTGAGLVLVRFLGTGGKPTTVVEPGAWWTGDVAEATRHPGARSEMRLWIRPGSKITLHIDGAGDVSDVRSLSVRTDGPTFVDVTVPSREQGVR